MFLFLFCVWGRDPPRNGDEGEEKKGFLLSQIFFWVTASPSTKKKKPNTRASHSSSPQNPHKLFLISPKFFPRSPLSFCCVQVCSEAPWNNLASSLSSQPKQRKTNEEKKTQKLFLPCHPSYRVSPVLAETHEKKKLQCCRRSRVRFAHTQAPQTPC